MSHNQKRVTMDPERTGEPSNAVVERFPSTSGRVPGLICLATAAIVLVLAIKPLETGTPLGVAIVACFGALVTWVVMLRPAVWVTEQDLLLHNMVTTVRIPLAAIDKVVIAQVLVITAGGNRYVSPAIGYSLRQSMRNRSPRGRQVERTPVNTVQVFVEERILHHAREARERLRIVQGSPEQQALAGQVRRTPAWPEVAGMTLLAVAFVAWLVAF